MEEPQNVDVDISEKIKLFQEVCDEIFNHSPGTLKEHLCYALKNYFEEARTNGSSTRDADIQTECLETDNSLNISNDWNPDNIAEDVAAVAQQALEENGFVYDSATGLYYDHKLQCHYNPELKLYYYHQTGAYYTYDEETMGLKFFSLASEGHADESRTGGDLTTIEPEASKPIIDEATKRNYSPTTEEILKKAKEDKSDSEKEEGELSETDDEASPLSPSGPVIIEAGPKTFEPDHSKHIAPCIRVIVKSTTLPKLSPGTIFIVTCTGGTLGREGDHDILIPDQLVSKFHSSFRYVYKDGSYFFEVIDQGSKNGTFLNGLRLSESLEESNPFQVPHGSLISVGSTDLLCHIHPKDETCLDCEGYVCQEKRPDLASDLSLKAKYNYELASIKKKFGLEHSTGIKLPNGYEDRAESRRKKVGSSHSSEKTQSASFDTPIDKTNKGFSLMTKMGWVEGSGIGKTQGNFEPILPEGNEGKLGLGCDKTYNVPQKLVQDTQKIAIAKKTLERFQKANILE